MAYSIGIDLGGTNIVAGLVDEQLTMIAESSCKTLSSRGHEAIIDDMLSLVQNLLIESNIQMDEVGWIGIGCPGTIDGATGNVLYSNNIVWENVALGDIFTEKSVKKTYVENDANCAALGEYLKAGHKYNSIVFYTIGTGVGCGIILDGKLFSANHGAAPEMGHVTLVSGGEICTCGRKGCLESYASFTALIREGNRAAAKYPDSALGQLAARGEALTGKNIFDAAKQGDVAADKIVEEFIYAIGEGVTNAINLFSPDAVIIGGGISKEGDYVISRLKKQAQADVFCKNVKLPDIIMANIGNHAGIIGAAKLWAFQQ